MSKKDAQPEETPDKPVTEKPVKEKPVPVAPEEEVEEDLDDEPIKEEKPKAKKVSKKRAKLTVLQAAVLETIRERSQRPRAIQTIIRGIGGVDVPRNEIIRSLNELKGKGFVEKVSAKAWQAK